MGAKEGPLQSFVVGVGYSIIEVLKDSAYFAGIDSVCQIEGYFEEIVPIMQMSEIKVVIIAETVLGHRSA